jgi:hypothetical protein
MRFRNLVVFCIITSHSLSMAKTSFILSPSVSYSYGPLVSITTGSPSEGVYGPLLIL